MSKSAEQKRVTIEQLSGFKQLRRVSTLLSSLHEVGCGRDRARNRELFFDDYVLLMLLYLFNPLIDSMRTLRQAADLPQMQKRLGIKRFSLGSFSESCRWNRWPGCRCASESTRRRGRPGPGRPAS